MGGGGPKLIVVIVRTMFILVEELHMAFVIFFYENSITITMFSLAP